MTPRDIDHFFELLAEQCTAPMTIILTGGAAALLMGGVRPTLDIDCAITAKEMSADVDQIFSRITQQTQINVQYSEDIDRWSMISFLNYKKHTRPYKVFGKIKVEILEPEYWSIGKMTRFYASDVDDMVAVFKKQKTDPNRLVQVWSKALKKSPRSNAQFNFKRHVAHFFQKYGPTIWGKSFSAPCGDFVVEEPEKLT